MITYDVVTNSVTPMSCFLVVNLPPKRILIFKIMNQHFLFFLLLNIYYVMQNYINFCNQNKHCFQVFLEQQSLHSHFPVFYFCFQARKMNSSSNNLCVLTYIYYMNQNPDLQICNINREISSYKWRSTNTHPVQQR